MPGIYSVTQINNYIKNLFSRDFCLQRVTVKGEVSNCKYHPAGHIYFTLKDENAAINCCMFKSSTPGLSFRLSNGQLIEASGQITVYEKGGTYELYVRSAVLSGTGDLYERFLRLKNELEEMGMFDAVYKKPIPQYAGRIGIVTAETGAAIRDIVNVSLRRNPYVDLYLMPCLVQGENAAKDIAAAIRRIDACGMDVLIVGRGGGSIEDLWAFNEEVVARAIFECRTPVISAVGHETDFTIADFVSDLRAPTPSAAAELANFDFNIFESQMEGYRQGMERILYHRLNVAKANLAAGKARVNAAGPFERLNRMRESIPDITEKMEMILSGKIGRLQSKNELLTQRLSVSMNNKLLECRHRLMMDAGKLDALSPLKKISGGYGYLMSEKGAVRSTSDVNSGDRITAFVCDGKIIGTVNEVIRG